MDPPAPAPPRRIRKRYLIPGIVLGALLLLVLGAWIRGTWADTEERNPASAADGAVTQLYRGLDGRKYVRCAVVLDHPPEAVWKVVTDYDRFPEIFPTISAAKGTREPNGTWHLTGTVTSAVGDFKFDSQVHHEESPGKYLAWWDGKGEGIVHNRGSWTLTPAGPGKTLLVYMLDVELAGYPNFIVRNVLLIRQESVVEAVGEWLKKKHP